MPHQKKERVAAISKDLINSQSFVNIPPKQCQSIKIAKPKYMQNQQQQQQKQSMQNNSDVPQRKQPAKLNQTKNSTEQNQGTQQQSHQHQQHHVTQAKGRLSPRDMSRPHINKCISGNFFVIKNVQYCFKI